MIQDQHLKAEITSFHVLPSDIGMMEMVAFYGDIEMNIFLEILGDAPRLQLQPRLLRGPAQVRRLFEPLSQTSNYAETSTFNNTACATQNCYF